MSSAKIYGFNCSQQRAKNSGHRTEPCGTPKLMTSTRDKQSPNLPQWILFDKQDLKFSNANPLTQYTESFLRSLE